MSATAPQAGRQPLLPSNVDLPALLLVLVGLLVVYIPEYVELSQTIWRSDEQGHGPIIFAVSLWLLYGLRHALAELPSRPATFSGVLILAIGALLYAFGRSQDIWIFSIGSQIWVLAGLTLLFKGWRGLRLIWFPIFFMLFMVPLPEALVASVTAPLKSAVSLVASNLLYAFGLPGRPFGRHADRGPVPADGGRCLCRAELDVHARSPGHALHEPDALHVRGAQRPRWPSCWCPSPSAPTSAGS